MRVTCCARAGMARGGRRAAAHGRTGPAAGELRRRAAARRPCGSPRSPRTPGDGRRGGHRAAAGDSVVGIVADVELVGVQKTLSPVLKAKALDNRLPAPILGDA